MARLGCIGTLLGKKKCAALGCNRGGAVLDDVETTPGIIQKEWVCEGRRGGIIQNIAMDSEFTGKAYTITKDYADSAVGCEDADSGMVQAELNIVLKASDWYRFQSQPFYRELIEYLDNVKTL